MLKKSSCCFSVSNFDCVVAAAKKDELYRVNDMLTICNVNDMYTVNSRLQDHGLIDIEAQ